MSEMKKNINWKVPIITGVGIITFILMVVFGVQGSQNTAISLEEQVNAASLVFRFRKCRELVMYRILLTV